MTDGVEEARRMIRLAKTIQRSVWYESALVSISKSEQPTLSMVVELVDKLAIYSADAGSPSSGDR